MLRNEQWSGFQVSEDAAGVWACAGTRVVPARVFVRVSPCGFISALGPVFALAAS